MSVARFPAVRRAVLWVPDWPVAAAVAEGMAGGHEAVVICGPRGVLATSPMARRAGVRRGMRRRTAQSLCPELMVIDPDEAREVRAFDAVVQAAEGVAAGVEMARPGLLLVPARGPSRYLGSEDALAAELIGAVAEGSGIESQVGIADGLLTALIAARESCLVPPDLSGEFLVPHDVRVLQHVAFTRRHREAVEELIGLLRRLGVRTLGALAGLPESDVLARFGTVGVQSHRLARGGDLRPPTVRRHEEDVHVSCELDPPAERSDAAVFAARRLAESLAGRLVRRGHGCERVTITARTTEGVELIRTWRLDDVPSAADLTDRVRWQIDGWLSGRSGHPPGAPLSRLALTAEGVVPASGLGDGLWGRRDRGEVEAERVALRLHALLGEESVRAPVAQGGRDPRTRVRTVVWGDDPSPVLDPDAPWPGRLPEPSPSTMLSEPVRAEVLAATGGPVGVDRRGLLTDPPAVFRAARRSVGIEGWAGPWAVRERWWERGERHRAWLQVATATGEVMLLELTDDGWQVVGRYD